jgi:hypothetical protein
VEFQQANSLDSDGVVGPKTRAKIVTSCTAPKPDVVSHPLILRGLIKLVSHKNHPPVVATHTIGGTTSGLGGAGLVLQNNGTDNLSISANGSFTFATLVAEGAPYNITVLQQPSGQTCVVTNNTGTMGVSDVTNISINCSVALLSITIAPSSSQLPRTINEQFTATAHYADSSTVDITSSVTWDTSDHAVATINTAGLVTGVSPGMTQVSATVDGIIGTTNLTVTSAVLVSITISPINPNVARGDTLQLSAVGMFSDSSSVDITNQATWTSTLTGIATVNDTDHKGSVTGVAGGASSIRADFQSVTGTVTLHVGV